MDAAVAEASILLAITNTNNNEQNKKQQQQEEEAMGEGGENMGSEYTNDGMFTNVRRTRNGEQFEQYAAECKQRD